MMGWIDWVLIIRIGAILLSIFFIYFFLRQEMHVYLLKLLSPKQKYTANRREMQKLSNTISKLPLPDRLYIVRLIMGHSYRLVAKVGAGGIEIEGIGSMAEEGTNEELQEYTG